MMIHLIPLSDECYKHVISSITLPLDYLKEIIRTQPDSIRSTTNSIPDTLSYKLYLILVSEDSIESIIEMVRNKLYISSEIFILSNCPKKTNILKNDFEINIEFVPTVYVIENYHSNSLPNEFCLNFNKEETLDNDELLRASTMLFFSKYVLEGAYVSTKELDSYQRDLRVFKEKGIKSQIDSSYVTDLIHRVFHENIVLTSTFDPRRSYDSSQKILSFLDIRRGLNNLLDSLDCKELIRINKGAPNVNMYQKTYALICNISNDIRSETSGISEPNINQVLIRRVIRNVLGMHGSTLRLDEKIDIVANCMKELKLDLEKRGQDAFYDNFSTEVKCLITKHRKPNINTDISKDPIIQSLNHWFLNTSPNIKILPYLEDFDNIVLGFISTLLSNRESVFKMKKNSLFSGINLLFFSNPRLYESIMYDIMREKVTESPKFCLNDNNIKYTILEESRLDELKGSEDLESEEIESDLTHQVEGQDQSKSSNEAPSFQDLEKDPSLLPQDEVQDQSEPPSEKLFLSSLMSDLALQKKLKEILKSKANKIIEYLKSLEVIPNSINEISNAKGVGDKAIEKVKSLFNVWAEGIPNHEIKQNSLFTTE